MQREAKDGCLDGFHRQRWVYGWVHGWVLKVDDCIVFVSVDNAKRGKGGCILIFNFGLAIIYYFYSSAPMKTIQHIIKNLRIIPDEMC